MYSGFLGIFLTLQLHSRDDRSFGTLQICIPSLHCVILQLIILNHSNQTLPVARDSEHSV